MIRKGNMCTIFFFSCHCMSVYIDNGRIDKLRFFVYFTNILVKPCEIVYYIIGYILGTQDLNHIFWHACTTILMHRAV